MIKFFRHIRKSLLMENKTGKYFKYAIGEIVLVVIGILIALYINNWNIQQKDNIREHKILQQLKEDYSDNLVQLEEKIKMRTTLIKSSINVLDLISKWPNTDVEKIIPELTNIIKDPTFDPIDNSLIASGEISLIQNDSLKRVLSRWTSDVKQVQQVELEWQKMRTDIFIPFLIKAGIARNVHAESWKGIDTPIEFLDKTIDSRLVIGTSKFNPILTHETIIHELESIVSSAISPNHVANLQSITLRVTIIKIIELINSEIND